jgi:hypothetical protein
MRNNQEIDNFLLDMYSNTRRFRHAAREGLGRGQRVNYSQKKQLHDSQNRLIPRRVSDTLEALALLPVPDFTTLILQVSQQ